MMYKDEIDKLLPNDIYEHTSYDGVDTLEICDKVRVVKILSQKRNISELEAITIIKASTLDNPFKIDDEVFSYD